MNKHVAIYGTIALVILMVPMFLHDMGLTATQTNIDSKQQFSETVFPQIDTQMDSGSMEEVNPDMIFFTEMPSSDSGVYYVCRQGIDPVAYFGKSMVKYLSGKTFFTLEFPGSRLVEPVGEKPTGSVTNYFFGTNSADWKTGLTDYSVLRYNNIYPGIDLVYKTKNGNLKYEFIVSPQANPEKIRLEYSDAEAVVIDENRVTASREGAKMTDTNLLAFQRGTKTESVDCSFVATNPRILSFELGDYEPNAELVIDPLCIAYSSFLGGSQYEKGNSIAVEDGHAYVVGYTESPDFPTANAYNSTPNGGDDLFVMKLARDGQSLVYSTFLGGSGNDVGYDIAVEDGYAYVTGTTYSSDYPTVNAYDSKFNGSSDCFLTKLASDGQSLIYSTLLGGISSDNGLGVATEDGYPYLTGSTASADFPMTNPYNSTIGTLDAFVTKFAGDGQSLIYSTFLGGDNYDYGHDIAVEDGYAYVTGYTWSTNFPTVNAYDSTFNGGNWDCFVTKMASDGQSLAYSTYLGGSLDETGEGIEVEDGHAYITGDTASPDFPIINAYDETKGGNYECFVTKLATDGQSLVYSTYLGGNAYDAGEGIAVEDGYVCVIGGTESPDFPTVNAYNSTFNEGNYDCFVTKLASDGQSLVYSTFLGGSNLDWGIGIGVENGSIYATGFTGSSNFPAINAYNSTYGGDTDCFVAVLSQDSDSDGLLDWEEYVLYESNPYCIDTDNDNFLDGYEVEYGTNPTLATDYPAMPQAWYDDIYEDLDGNATLIQNLIEWSEGNATLLETVKLQLEENATLLQQVISWLDGNHTAIQTLFTYVDGNATLLIETIEYLDGNATQLNLVAALATDNQEWLQNLNSTAIGNITEIREVLDKLGVSIGDTDYDGLDDLDELEQGTDIQCIDTDNDNLNDAYEVEIGTDPLEKDSDQDGYDDGSEIMSGSDPLDAANYPGTETSALMLVGVGAGASVAVIAVVLFILWKRKAGS